MKSIIIFLFFILLLGCTSSKKTVEIDPGTTKPILKTDHEAELSNSQKKIIVATIISDVQFYSESCEEMEVKATDSDDFIFVEVLKKNPPQTLLNLLNKNINTRNKFLSAKKGVLIYKHELLIGYKKLNTNEDGYLISIDDIIFQNESTAMVDLSQSKTSLSGVSKTYKLNKSNSKWEVTGCKINSYN